MYLVSFRALLMSTSREKHFLHISYKSPRHSAHSSDSKSTQAAVHAAIAAAHSVHSQKLHEVSWHCVLHPPSQLQQDISHFPFPQHKISPFLLQHFASRQATNPAAITIAKKNWTFMMVAWST